MKDVTVCFTMATLPYAGDPILAVEFRVHMHVAEVCGCLHCVAYCSSSLSLAHWSKTRGVAILMSVWTCIDFHTISTWTKHTCN